MTDTHDPGPGDRTALSPGPADAVALGRWLDDGGRDAADGEPSTAAAPPLVPTEPRRDR